MKTSGVALALITSSALPLGEAAEADTGSELLFFADLNAHGFWFDDGLDFDFEVQGARGYTGQLVAATGRMIFEAEASVALVLDENRPNDYDERSGALAFSAHYLFELGGNPAGVFATYTRAKVVEDQIDSHVQQGLVGLEYGISGAKSQTAFQVFYGDRLGGPAQLNELIQDHYGLAITYSRALGDRTSLKLTGYGMEGGLYDDDDKFFSYAASASLEYALSDRVDLRAGVDYWRTEEVDGSNVAKAAYTGAFIGFRFMFGNTTREAVKSRVPFDAPNFYREYAWGQEAY